ncbi:TetR/AcrR family transcriptional regulator [Streptomyces sp. TS71-3]|uniref:TetR/AcrR family transcriptional regulator n=1 Tax=Streptomyces sp. TS71-3 TaxID=2733862 RepID=UPI001B02EFEE|nr:TetR/AcrR family transcriptional regulator [Streptomyces sp. TS71-3]GHJ42082.1 TetR family transcriptional regulator [Streptomyces sp. TS71-3]
MSATGQPGSSYHHGDLPAALVRATLEIVAECGVHGFSVAEAARRTGVSPAAPYRHFADRNTLLAAAADTIAHQLQAACREAAAAARRPEDRLAAVATAYVRSAARFQSCFDLLMDAELRSYRPELRESTRSLVDLQLPSALALAEPQSAVALLEALRCLSRGYAALLLDGSFGPPMEVCESVAERAGRAARSLASGYACQDQAKSH